MCTLLCLLFVRSIFSTSLALCQCVSIYILNSILVNLGVVVINQFVYPVFCYPIFHNVHIWKRELLIYTFLVFKRVKLFFPCWE